MAFRYFKVRCEMANGSVQDYAVSMSPQVKNIDEAIAHLTAVDGYQDGVPVTRTHYRDEATGEFISIFKAEPVQVEPFVMDGAVLQRIAAIANAPKPVQVKSE